VHQNPSSLSCVAGIALHEAAASYSIYRAYLWSFKNSSRNSPCAHALVLAHLPAQARVR
jgi:hypothetical protein